MQAHGHERVDDVPPHAQGRRLESRSGVGGAEDGRSTSADEQRGVPGGGGVQPLNDLCGRHGEPMPVDQALVVVALHDREAAPLLGNVPRCGAGFHVATVGQQVDEVGRASRSATVANTTAST